MALSPADFAAYSRATGTPYPEDPEERAQMVPEVLEFRRNQLRSQQEESNLPGILGAVAAGLGVLGVGALGARRLARQPKAQTKLGVNVADLSQVSTTKASNTPPPSRIPDPWGSIATVPTAIPQATVDLSAVRSRSVIPTEEESFQQYINQLKRDIPEPTAKELEFPAARPTTYVMGTGDEEYVPYRADPREFAVSPEVAAARREDAAQRLLLAARQRQENSALSFQTLSALESGEDQMTGRIMHGVQRNEDLDSSQVNEIFRQTGNAELAASLTPDGVPADQTQNLKVLDLANKKSFSIPPRALGQEEAEDSLLQQARQYLRSQEIDTDYDYSAENIRQTAQVQDRIQRATELRNKADQILSELRQESRPSSTQVSPEQFASAFNKQYREELSDQIKAIDNARQRVELAAMESDQIAEDLQTLLVGTNSPVDVNMRGGALRGGKPNITGEIIYQDEAGAFVSADTGLKTRQEQGPQFRAKAETLNKLYSSSDEDLTYLISQNQQAQLNNQPITKLEADTARMASQVLRQRAINNPEPTKLQLDALERAKTSINETQRILQENRNLRPTLSPGPAQDVARSMETLRRGMIVEPSEPLPTYPSVQQLRTGYIDEDLGPILGASQVYTGAAAEAAGPVIFTGKSKAESVIPGPKIIGTVKTPVGSFQTQENPDVLGTVYNVAGTPQNRRIAEQIEQNAQRFLSDAVLGGLQLKATQAPETYVTPTAPYGPRRAPVQGPNLSPLSLAGAQGLPGLEASQRTGYAQYQPGRSVPARVGPFIGEMSGGTVIATPQTTTTLPITRRDVGAPAGSRMDLTRQGAKSRYYSDEPQFVTNMEPAPIGPITQSPGLSSIGGIQETLVMGAGNKPVIQQTTLGQRIAYPRMQQSVNVPTYKGYYEGSFYNPQGTVTNIPRYGIDPGAEDWRNDLMRSAYRRGGPIKTYQT